MKKKRIRIISTLIITMLLFMSNSFAFAANNISLTEDVTYGYHYVIAGYTDTADLSTSRLYINTGWSSHGFVWIGQSYRYRQMPCI
jgi:phage tail sheath gpL-like